MENSGAKYLVTIDLFLQNIKQACDIYTGIDKVILLSPEAPEDCVTFGDLIKDEDGSLYGTTSAVDPFDDFVALPYSSGTTGPPKAVLLIRIRMCVG